MNPQRCETCRKEDCDNHPKQVGFYEQYGNIIADIIKDDQKLFSEYGCAIHSSAKSEQEIRNEVLEEVRSACIRDETVGYTIFRILEELRKGEP